MNSFLLSLIDQRIAEAMNKFSKLLVESAYLESYDHEKIAMLSRKIVDTYIKFFHCVNIAPSDYHYNTNSIVKQLRVLTVDREHFDHLDPIENKLYHIIPKSPADSLIPVNVHLNKAGQIYLYSGIGIFESSENIYYFYLNELSIPIATIKYSAIQLHYLDDIILGDKISQFTNLRHLAASYGKNYNQFQKDCKIYFGDTFHQFHNKLKMLDVLEDMLFTDYSLKEIAYRNHFSNYNSMYFLFNTRYHFQLHAIPRLINEL